MLPHINSAPSGRNHSDGLATGLATGVQRALSISYNKKNRSLFSSPPHYCKFDLLVPLFCHLSCMLSTRSMDDTTSATSIWKTMEGAGRNLGVNLLIAITLREAGTTQRQPNYLWPLPSERRRPSSGPIGRGKEGRWECRAYLSFALLRTAHLRPFLRRKNNFPELKVKSQKRLRVSTLA